MGKTSSESKSRWEKDNYKKYMVRLRVNDDKEIIDFIEAQKACGFNTSEIFKTAIKKLSEKN